MRRQVHEAGDGEVDEAVAADGAGGGGEAVEAQVDGEPAAGMASEYRTVGCSQKTGQWDGNGAYSGPRDCSC